MHTTTFCRDYHCVDYFLWGLPLCALLFVGITPVCTTSIFYMTHYDITMGNNIARDIHCDVTMSNEVAIYAYITMYDNVVMNLFMYYYAYL